jgi:hypothetical protein
MSEFCTAGVTNASSRGLEKWLLRLHYQDETLSMTLETTMELF